MANLMDRLARRDEFEAQQARKDRQEALTAQQAGYTLNEQTNRYEPTKRVENTQQMQTLASEANLEAMQAQMRSMESQLNSRDMTSITSDIVRGNYKDAKKKLKSNTNLKRKLAESGLDAIDFAPIDFVNDDELLAESGVVLDHSLLSNEDTRSNMNAALFKVQGKDGNWRVVSTNDLVAQTNYWENASKEERELYTQQQRRVNSTLQGLGLLPSEEEASSLATEQTILKGNIMNEALETGDPKEVMQAFMMTNPEKFAGKGGAQRRDAYAQATEAFLQSNPNPTKNEWQNFNKTYLTKTLQGTSEVRQEGDLSDLNQAQKRASAMYKSPTFNKEEARNTENEILAKLTSGQRKEAQEKISKLKANHNMSSNLDRIVRDKGVSVDKDVIAYAQTFVDKKLGRESAKAMDNVDFETRSGILLANFMKEMSGATVSDKERATLTNILLGGNLSDETYVTKAINSFSDELRQQNKQLSTNLADTAPYSINTYGGAGAIDASEFDTSPTLSTTMPSTLPSAADFE